jgi:hypothetical protein
MPDTVRTQPVARSVYSRDCTRAIQVPTFSSRQPREKADSTLKYSPIRAVLSPRQMLPHQGLAARAWRAEKKNGGVTRTGAVLPSPLCPALAKTSYTLCGINSTVFGKYLLDQHPELHGAS